MAKIKDYPIADTYPYGDDVKMDVISNLGGVKIKSMNEGCSADTIDCDFYKWTRKTTYKLVDKKKFIKVYQDEIQTIFKLSSTAQRILWFVMSKMKKKVRYVELFTNICMKECGFKTRKSVTDGICELIEKNILYRTAEPMSYWINPAIVFNGDRLEFIREYILEEEK